MIRYFCFHSSMKEVKVLCLFCPPPANFTFIHVTFSALSRNNVVRMLFLDLVTIRRTSWFHLKYLVLLPHAQLEIIRGQVWKSGHRRRSERDFIEMTKRCHEDCEMHHHHHLILVLVLRPHWTATDHNPSVFEFCKIQTVFLSLRPPAWGDGVLRGEHEPRCRWKKIHYKTQKKNTRLLSQRGIFMNSQNT